MFKWLLFSALLGVLLLAHNCKAEDETETSTPIPPKVDNDIGKHADGSKTDDEVVQKEEEAIKLDGLSAKEFRNLVDSSEKHQFQTEVNRMMKLIINSLYKNKEIFLRELISNASDALDKIRFMSLTDKTVLGDKEELTIRIKIDKENRMLHITDTGIGMTRADLIQFLGTIAKSDTSEFFNRVQKAQTEGTDGASMSDLIGQFGVGFYSSFLVADKVIVTSKNNADDQYIWESDSSSFNVFKDPRGNTLGRGTTVSLHIKEEAGEYLEVSTLDEIIRKYSQFINFNIYLWKSKTVKEEVPDDDATETKKSGDEEKKSDDDAAVEDDKEEEKKSKTKTVDKTVWDWELMNESKPIWQRKASDVTDEEYKAFYKSFAKESDEPMIYSHFTAEGEVTFKSILYVPKAAPFDLFSNYNKKADAIKLYVRRVFITDNLEEMMPKYLSFIRGVVDSDDLPLNVSRETLQQSKLLKVIKKKLVRKALDMLKKISPEDYIQFWKEYGTNIKLGVIEDSANRTRLAKLLRFHTSLSKDKQISLSEYIERMKPKQESIYFIAAMSMDEAQKSPFVERILKKGYEVLYLIDPVDQYCMQSLPEYEGKKFQNVAKDGLELDKADSEQKKQLEKTYEPLLRWLKEKLSDKISDAKVSDRLVQTPMAVVASQWGYDGNMERIARAQAYQKSGGDSTMNYYLNQKKTLEINPRHPLIKDLLRRVEDSQNDKTAFDLATVMWEAATLRSGYDLKDSAGFADRIESMLRRAMSIPADEQVEEEPTEEETDTTSKSADSTKNADDDDDNVIDDDADTKSKSSKKDVDHEDL